MHKEECDDEDSDKSNLFMQQKKRDVPMMDQNHNSFPSRIIHIFKRNLSWLMMQNQINHIKNTYYSMKICDDCVKII